MLLDQNDYLEGASVNTDWVQKRKQLIADALRELAMLETFKVLAESELAALRSKQTELQILLD